MILFVDEFDLILSNPSLRDLFLSTLRGMKQTRNDYLLQSVVAIGTFSLLGLEDKSVEESIASTPSTLSTLLPTLRSPFNARYSLLSYWKKRGRCFNNFWLPEMRVAIPLFPLSKIYGGRLMDTKD